jgi:AraC-like DNA-binding protein
MVDLGQHLFADAVETPAAHGVAALRLSELVARVPPAQLRRPRCGDHHVLMLVAMGHGRHAVDFVEYPCRPGTVLWGRPGQVHQFGGQPGLDATLLVFPPGLLLPSPALNPLLDDPTAPVCWLPTGEDEDAIIAEVTQLAIDAARYPSGDPVGTDLLRHELAVLLTRVASLAGVAAGGSGGSGGDVMARFRREVEASFARTRRVEDYADRLGYSVRTLTRACLAATGQSAKQVLDARVALAAKRLLGCSDVPVAEIGRRLGFPEPTNFGRFFLRETGQTPGDFRAAHAIPRPRASVER